MSVALLVITDGRDECLDRCLTSAAEHLQGPITERWMHDDTGDSDYRARLAQRYPTFRQVDDHGPRQGFGGAIRRSWQHLSHHSRADWIFHVEQDFVFTRPVDLAAMMRVLTNRPQLVQMALRRQPWNPAEIAAGGVVEQHPDAYLDQSDAAGHEWLAHRLFWTTNPSLYHRSLIRMGWPHGQQSEGRFTRQLLRFGSLDVVGDDVQFGYWGARSSGEWVQHIGVERVGCDY